MAELVENMDEVQSHCSSDATDSKFIYLFLKHSSMIEMFIYRF